MVVSPEVQGSALDWTDRITHVVPAQQPDSVYQIAQRLFPAYTVEGGKVHLAGCHLEDRLLLRLGYRYGTETLDRYTDGDGRDVSAELITALGLGDTIRLERPPAPAEPRIARFLAVGLPAVERRLPLDPPHELVAITAVWCKFAEGKLRFTIDEASADLPFVGWTRTLEPPPYVCPRTGALTFSVALTDDGQIVAANRLSRCDVTGRRAVDDEMVTCSVTGERVLADLTAVCPVTQARVLKSRLVACDMCGQMVSPQAVKKERCAACRDLQPVTKDDPRMARVLDEHAALDRWRHWKIAETGAVYILLAQGWMRQLLVVVDKSSLELRRVATGSRFGQHWHVAPPAEHENLLSQ